MQGAVIDQNSKCPSHRVTLTPQTKSLPQIFTKCMGWDRKAQRDHSEIHETCFIQGRDLLTADSRKKRTEENPWDSRGLHRVSSSGLPKMGTSKRAERTPSQALQAFTQWTVKHQEQGSRIYQGSEPKSRRDEGICIKDNKKIKLNKTIIYNTHIHFFRKLLTNTKIVKYNMGFT